AGPLLTGAPTRALSDGGSLLRAVRRGLRLVIDRVRLTRDFRVVSATRIMPLWRSTASCLALCEVLFARPQPTPDPAWRIHLSPNGIAANEDSCHIWGPSAPEHSTNGIRGCEIQI